MFSILLVEDAVDYQMLVSKILNNFRIITTSDPDSVHSLLQKESIDLILLDIGLPGRDGYSVLQEIQSNAKFSKIPVFCLSGRDQISDKVTAFSLGADDFIQKPFHPLELKARIEARLSKEHSRKSVTENMHVGSIKIDLSSHRVYSMSGEEIVLTQTEFKVLQYFGKHPGKVFSRDQILSSIWGDQGEVFDRTVDVHVCSLRKKLGNFGLNFNSVPGVGYKLIISNSIS